LDQKLWEQLQTIPIRGDEITHDGMIRETKARFAFAFLSPRTDALDGRQAAAGPRPCSACICTTSSSSVVDSRHHQCKPLHAKRSNVGVHGVWADPTIKRPAPPVDRGNLLLSDSHSTGRPFPSCIVYQQSRPGRAGCHVTATATPSLAPQLTSGPPLWLICASPIDHVVRRRAGTRRCGFPLFPQQLDRSTGASRRSTGPVFSTVPAQSTHMKRREMDTEELKRANPTASCGTYPVSWWVRCRC
jgi:hypothetical protein